MSPILTDSHAVCFDVPMTTSESAKDSPMETKPTYTNANLDGAAEALLDILTDSDYAMDRTCDLAAVVAEIAVGEEAFKQLTADEDEDPWAELQTDAENAAYERMARQMLTRWGHWQPARTSSWDGQLTTATFEETLPDSKRKVSVTVHVDALNDGVNWAGIGTVSVTDALFYADLIQAAALWISRQTEAAQAKAEEG